MAADGSIKSVEPNGAAEGSHGASTTVPKFAHPLDPLSPDEVRDQPFLSYFDYSLTL